MVEDEIIFQTDIIIAETTKKINELKAKHTQELANKDRIILAYQLLVKNTPIEQIIAETGLTAEEIHNL